MPTWDLQRNELLENPKGALPTAQLCRNSLIPPELCGQGHTHSVPVAGGKGEAAAASSRPFGCHGLKMLLQHPPQHHWEESSSCLFHVIPLDHYQSFLGTVEFIWFLHFSLCSFNKRNLYTFEELSAFPQCNWLLLPQNGRIYQLEPQECAQILNLEKSSRCLKPQHLNRNAEFQCQTVNCCTSSPSHFIWFCVCISWSTCFCKLCCITPIYSTGAHH